MDRIPLLISLLSVAVVVARYFIRRAEAERRYCQAARAFYEAHTDGAVPAPRNLRQGEQR